MSNRAKRYNNCPLCLDVQLVKVEGEKHTWECPACKLRIYPNRRFGGASRHYSNVNPNILRHDVRVWAAESERSFQP
ncbi:MAG: hypothetical protein ABSA75_13510 [Candidatus Bathyarchaeia archaeon]